MQPIVVLHVQGTPNGELSTANSREESDTCTALSYSRTLFDIFVSSSSTAFVPENLINLTRAKWHADE